MANIARYNPIREITTIDPLDEPFEEFFSGFFLRPLRWEADTANRLETFRVDVIENDKAFRVHAEIPGVRRGDINITINGDELAISAESKIEKDVKDGSGTVVCSERQY